MSIICPLICWWIMTALWWQVDIWHVMSLWWYTPFFCSHRVTERIPSSNISNNMHMRDWYPKYVMLCPFEWVLEFWWVMEDLIRHCVYICDVISVLYGIWFSQGSVLCTGLTSNRKCLFFLSVCLTIPKLSGIC